MLRGGNVSHWVCGEVPSVHERVLTGRRGGEGLDNLKNLWKSVLWGYRNYGVEIFKESVLNKASISKTRKNVSPNKKFKKKKRVPLPKEAGNLSRPSEGETGRDRDSPQKGH